MDTGGRSVSGSSNVARGRGEPYTDEENDAIMAGPPREATRDLQARLVAAGFPQRSIDALKAQKKVLRRKALGLGPKSRPQPHRAAALGERYEELATEIEHLTIRREEALAELKDVSLAMVKVGLGLEGTVVSPEVAEAIRQYVESFVTSQPGE